MLSDPRFRHGYHLVTFEIRDGRRMTSRMYVRLDGAVGVQRERGRVHVPGYLLSKGGKSRASFDAAGELRLRVTPKQPGELKGLRLDEGTWRLSVHATGGAPSVEVLDSRGKVLTSLASANPFTLERPGEVTLKARAEEKEPVELGSITLARE